MPNYCNSLQAHEHIMSMGNAALRSSVTGGVHAGAATSTLDSTSTVVDCDRMAKKQSCTTNGFMLVVT